MAVGYWHQMAQDAAADMFDQVQKYLKLWIEEVWPSLVELSPPHERAAYYQSIDWNMLRDNAPLFWEKMSADALRLINRDQQSERDYGFQQQDSIHALRAEQAPLGESVTSPNAFALGQNTPLPLGTNG